MGFERLHANKYGLKQNISLGKNFMHQSFSINVGWTAGVALEFLETSGTDKSETILC